MDGAGAVIIISCEDVSSDPETEVADGLPDRLLRVS